MAKERLPIPKDLAAKVIFAVIPVVNELVLLLVYAAPPGNLF